MEWFTINAYYFIPLWAFLLDCLVGDPRSSWHPVVLIGRVISFYEKLLYHAEDSPERKLLCGGATVILTLVTVTGVALLLLMLAGSIHFWVAYVLEILIVYITISPRSLAEAGAELAGLLARKQLAKARQRVGWIVGRDTTELDESEITRATIETIAENTVDGIVSPLLFFAFFGPLGALFYRTANTMDSMLGYKNEKYLYFGRFPARMDDVFNYIPSRTTALFMIAAAFLTGMDGKNAWKIYLRDRRKHASPNAAQTEAVCAGALRVRLAGDAVYFGRLYKKEYLGDSLRPIEAEDIRRAGRLMYVTAVLMLIIFGVLKAAVIL